MFLPAIGEAVSSLPLAIFFLYLGLILLIGFWGLKTKANNTLREYYISNGKLSLLPLLFTIYATQLSGNTFLGFSAKAYRDGFVVFFLLVMWCLISSMFWFYVPKLKKLSDKNSYLTVGDYIQNRFSYRPLTQLINLIFLFVLANYILSNMKAMGLLMEYNLGDYFSFSEGILFLTIILIVYQCLGGMKSVALTDMIQGCLMLVGSGVTFYLILFKLDFTQVLSTIKSHPVTSVWWKDLDIKTLLNWGSFLVVASSTAFYPHLVQRVFAAKSSQSLKVVYRLTIIFALLTTFISLILGFSARAFFPDLLQTENVALKMIEFLSQGTVIGYIFMAFFFTVIISAAMSTVDSASLTTSSIIVNDFILSIRPKTSLRSAHIWGPLSIVLVMLLLAIMAIYVNKDLFFIIKIKLEILILIVPTILLGLKEKRPNSQVLFWSLLMSLSFVVGVFILVEFGVLSSSKIFSLNVGFVGFILNLMMIYVLSIKFKK